MDVYAVVGNPVGHSLSPPMHEAAFEELGLDARYVGLEPAPGDGAAAVEAAETLGLAGLNVTIPFKEAVLDAVEPDDLARRVGAVNTVDFSGPVPTGHNTDVAGVQRTFERFDVALRDANAVIVGAGGAARATSVALCDAGASVHIANRTRSHADRLAADIGGEAHGLDALPALLPGADVLVNATSVGMDEDVSPVPERALHGDLAVLDAVYSPLSTRLLRDAEAAGATVIDGAWMLLYQGVEAFERWTDGTAPVSVMNAALRDRL